VKVDAINGKVVTIDQNVDSAFNGDGETNDDG